MTDLSILCVTNLGAHTPPFIGIMTTLSDVLDAEFVIALDGATLPTVPHERLRMTAGAARTLVVESGGYIESVLDEAVAACSGDYILRLDDDECCSPAMVSWLAERVYREHQHWAFPRMHLWPDKDHYLVNTPLWPDLQTRLSVKHMAGQRTQIHQGSPFGTGHVADRIAIEHHKFLVKDRTERERLLAHYERLLPSANDWAAFSVPELFEGQLVTEPVLC